MADSSQTNLAYVAESTYGTTPATPTLKTCVLPERLSTQTFQQYNRMKSAQIVTCKI